MKKRLSKPRLSPRRVAANEVSSEPNTTSIKSKRPIFPVVGIGASAGGLDAVTRVLKGLGEKLGLAIVIVQHLDPTHESYSTEILSRSTSWPITEATDRLRLVPDHIYVMPPNCNMTIANGCLRLSPRKEIRGLHLPIDHFFQSLAHDRQALAIGVVLSGTASDGTQGLLAIKAEGGIALVQEPTSAKFDGMPRSAIKLGVVDLILTPEAISSEITRIARHPSLSRGSVIQTASDEKWQKELVGSGAVLEKIFGLIRDHSHVDLTGYRRSTILRRLNRRMLVLKVESLEDYVAYLEKHPSEVKELFAEILIHVTRFFRDPDAFEGLKTEIMPEFLKTRDPGTPIRVWIPGCSTGEEAYSVAIILLECLEELNLQTEIQIFATDLSDLAISRARTGFYNEIEGDMSRERLNRYFDSAGTGYRIKKRVREICLFSIHDLTIDPPFSKLDLISCRNVFIYLTEELQSRVLSVFHYALKPKGILWLGPSESIGSSTKLFDLVDKSKKFYAKKNISRVPRLPSPQFRRGGSPALVSHLISGPRATGLDLEKESDQIALLEYAPPNVIVNEAMEILRVRGTVTPFIGLAPGQATLNLFKMASKELVPELRSLVREAREKKTTVKKVGVTVVVDGHRRQVNLKIVPMQVNPSSKDLCFLIFFESSLTASPGPKARGSRERAAIPKSASHVEELSAQLAASHEFCQALIEDYEAAQQELVSANEELQSTIEELQSTNEELETAKEELQSTNEELTTVNEELHSRNREMTIVTNDLVNLLSSVEIPIVMVGPDGKIRRFTPNAGRIMKLIPTDVGRPIGDIRTEIGIQNLDDIVLEVMKTLSIREIETQGPAGKWYRLQVRPYRTQDDKIDGAVISLMDIDAFKRAAELLNLARDEAVKANKIKDEFLATLSHELRTPLTTILGWAQQLQQSDVTDSSFKEGLAVIEQSARVQGQLIGDLLDVSCIQSGKMSLEFHVVDLKEAILTAVAAARIVAEKKGLLIENTFSEGTFRVSADAMRLQQVLWNLLSNSIKFTPYGGKIMVRLSVAESSEGKLAQIQVTDTGIGINSEFIPEIFQKFSQADSSKTRGYGGLGLGLAIVKSLVTMLKGTLGVESEGVGKGCTFTVRLPLLVNHRGALSETDASAGSRLKEPVRLDGIKVLVVDDSTDNLNLFSIILKSLGAEIRTAESVRQGLEVFAEFKPDVLLSDISMPGEDGYTLIRKIRSLGEAEGGKVPAIALTAYAGSENVQEALNAGFSSHLSKPVEKAALSHTVRKFVRVSPS